MTTKTEDIMAAMSACLTAAGISVRQDTEALFSIEDKPVIVLDCGDETPSSVISSSGVNYWDLTVTLQIGADGPIPKLAPELTRQAAHQALYADRSLGGIVIDIAAGPVNRGIDEVNPAAGITLAVYSLKYRVQENTV